MMEYYKVSNLSDCDLLVNNHLSFVCSSGFCNNLVVFVITIYFLLFVVSSHVLMISLCVTIIVITWLCILIFYDIDTNTTLI